MVDIYLEKKESLWLSLSSCVDIASAVFHCLLFQNKDNSRSELACEDDLDDADMLLREYFGYTIYTASQIDES